ncbi:MAG: dodecin family protein [Gemmatimonadota bacterium]|nr:dodecin family protein [Gemmatimonadota bacterium]
MTVAKVTEITASSTVSFDDAVKAGLARADKTLNGIKGAWVQQMTVDYEDGAIKAYRVNMKVTFLLND